MGEQINLYRRKLQNSFVENLTNAYKTSFQSGTNELLLMLKHIKRVMIDVRDRITRSLPLVHDEPTIYHLKDVLNKLEQALKSANKE